MRKLSAVLVATCALLAASAAPASSGDVAWQITVSAKCNLPCQPFPGGRSDHFTLYADGTGSGSVVYYTGFHMFWDFTWTTGPATPDYDQFFVTGGTIYIPDTKQTVPIGPCTPGAPICITPPAPLGVPVLAGHFNLSDLTGVPAPPPGMIYEVQVVEF